MEQMSLIDESYYSIIKEIVETTGNYTENTAREVGQVIRQTYRTVAERYGQEGLDEMMEIIRAEAGEGTQYLAMVEDNWT